MPSNGNNYNLLDGAGGLSADVIHEVDNLRLITQDPTMPKASRLEAFEDIIDSEVGDTSLVRARNIEREVGLRQIYLKFEGGNPTGTQKDRIAFTQAMDALRRGFDTISIATCGNYGAAMALAANLGGLQCRIFIPEGYHTARIREMEHLGAKIIRTTGDYETAVKLSMEDANTHEFYDANPGGVNTPIQMQAYGQIAFEIYDELRDAPKAVAVPVSNGTTLAGIYKGFLSLYRRGKTSRMPLLIAGSSFRKNPIVHAFSSNIPSCEDLDPNRIRETSVNEPLINWHAADGNHALYALRQTNGWAGDASDKAMQAFSRMIRDKEGLQVLPASTAGLIALMKKHQKDTFSGDRYVAVLTGRKSS